MVADIEEIMESWKVIEEGCYEVSDEGRIRSIGRKTICGHSIFNRDSTILKPRVDKDGYEIVTLWINGTAYTRKIHRLVALTFIANPESKPQVNHIGKDENGIINKRDNRVVSLAWSTAKENINHGFKEGLHSVGEHRKAGRAVKLTNKDIPVIREMIAAGHGNSEIGHLFGVTCGCIYSIRKGKSWSHI